jgi:UDP-2-acetamido-3-amino-2,3-dideoxy-glucuronate N-acetyltransferase
MSNFFVHETSIIDAGAKIGKDTKIWHFSHIMSKAVIGERCNIGQNVYIDNNVKIGTGVKIQNNVSVYANVEVEDDCFLGPSMVFTNVVNPRAFVERKNEFKNTLVKRGCSIGANATIICGITLGEYSFVGAGTLVNKDIPPYAMVVGVPMRTIGWISKNGQKLSFNEDGIGICSITKEKYKLIGESKVICLEDEK